jgi:hypothetical protein
MVHLSDLLNGCRVEDVGEITWRMGRETLRTRRNETGLGGVHRHNE